RQEGGSRLPVGRARALGRARPSEPSAEQDDGEHAGHGQDDVLDLGHHLLEPLDVVREAVAHASLIKRVRFPRAALVASVVLNDGFHYLMSLPVIALFLFMYGSSPSWAWLPGVPLLAVAQFGLVYGLALIVASINLYFRDLERLTALAITFAFFLTPIVYPPGNIPARYDWLVRLNPMAHIIRAWQDLFLTGTLDPVLVAASYAWAAGFLVLGGLTYRALSSRFAELV